MCGAKMLFLIIVAALLPTGFSAPLADCDKLTQVMQIQGLEQFFGSWIYTAESTNMPRAQFLTEKFVDNVWRFIYPANESNSFHVFQAQKMLGRCFNVTSKYTLFNNILHMELEERPMVVKQVLMRTNSSSCILLLSNYTIGINTYRGLQLLSRRPKLWRTEIEELKKQAACLNLPSPTFLHPKTDVCPYVPVESPDLIHLLHHVGKWKSIGQATGGFD
ncbi:uncharacterized protein LOC130919860 [Corythoichthys intestinalis]|uniref:uncharacterized protein LOC130919860 n=1 Tax=Corythoichthys intestinalis TaxID=161448 RepID=UPI0025A53061|nr:uncharacterized protein LOC130919860 [Corythoichthys intestinalis]